MEDNYQITSSYNKELYGIINEGNIEEFKEFEINNKELILNDVERFNILNTLLDIIPKYLYIIVDSFKANSNIFFYLIENYNYDLNLLICKLLKGDKYYIFDGIFFKKLLKQNYDIDKMIKYGINSCYYKIIDTSFESKLYFEIIIKSQNIFQYIELLKVLVNNGNILLIKEFLERYPYIFKTRLSLDNCSNLLDICGYNYKQYYDYSLYETDKTKNNDVKYFEILQLILPYIIYNIGTNETNKIISNFLNNIVIKHNALDYFELFKKHNLNINFNYVDNFDFPIIADCLKYGNLNTLKYLLSKNITIDMHTYFYPENSLIECSLNNYNYKISEVFLEHVTNNILNSNNTIITFLDNTNMYELIKIIFSSYSKKLSSKINSKKRKILLSSLKKQLNILYKFIINDQIYKDNINLKPIYLKIFFSKCLEQCFYNNISLEFLKKYNIEFLDKSLFSYNDLYTKEENFKFVIEKFKNIEIDNPKTLLLYLNCKCKIEKYLELFKKNNITFNKKQDYLNMYLHKQIKHYVVNCNKCCYCKNKNSSNIDYIINLLKEDVFVNNLLIANSILYKNYNFNYENDYGNNNGNNNGNNIHLEIVKKYFYHGLIYNDLFNEKKKDIIFKNARIILKQNNNSLLKHLYSYTLINYYLVKYIRNKKQSNIEKYKTKIIKINKEFKFVPIESNENINKYIGLEFKKQIYHIFNKKPVHITPLHCVSNINETHTYITEKADGIYKKNNLNSISEINSNIIAEYEEMDNIHIIFNLVNDNTILENIIYLRSIHEYAPKYTNFYFDESSIEEFKLYESKCFNNYIQNYKGNTKPWWPKMVWKIKNLSKIKYLEVLNNLKPFNVFKTDGYILYGNENEEIIKIKPFDLLTIDLKFLNNKWLTKENNVFTKKIKEGIYENNSIYRIYYDRELNIYIPKEKRTDKRTPNNISIINHLVKSHESQWTIKDIINNYKRNNYYQNKNDYNNIYLRSLIKKYSFKNFNYIKQGNILDLGCGYRQIYLNKIENSDLHLTDIDLNIVFNDLNYYSKKKNINIKKNLFDFSKSIKNQIKTFGNIFNYFDNKQLLNSKYDSIILLNTIHNCFPNYKDFKENINNFTKKDSRIIIRYLDRDTFSSLFENEENIELNNFGYVRKLKDNFININFNWCHNVGSIEYLVSKKDLSNVFENFKIIFEETKSTTKNKNIENIEKYLSCFKTIIYEKS